MLARLLSALAGMVPRSAPGCPCCDAGPEMQAPLTATLRACICGHRWRDR